jgi:hypothetical protein
MVFQAQRPVARRIHWQASRLVDDDGFTINKKNSVMEQGQEAVSG